MQTDSEFNHMTNHLNSPLLDFYLLYLEIDHPSQLRFDYDVFLCDDIELDDPDELWLLPQPHKFTSELTLNDVHTSGFAIGKIEFGRYGGRKIVIEQNAAPLAVYWKRC